MIGAVEAPLSEVASNVGNFYLHHPTQEDRRVYALGLLPVEGEVPIATSLPTYTILAAHWADTPPEHRATGRILFGLYPTLNRHRGQTALQLTGCEAYDIASGNLEQLTGAIVDVVTLDRYSELEYGYRPTPTSMLPDPKLRDAAFLNYQVSISGRESSTVSISPEGSVDIDGPETPHARKDLVAFTGSVCLEKDTQLYDRTKWSSEGELVFGNGHAYFLARRLVELVGGPALTTFQRMANKGHVGPDKPLPNLAKLFG